MTLRFALVVAATALPLFAGCQEHRAARLKEQELRMQDDRIYQLEDWIRQYNEQLNSCREENSTLRSGKPAASGRGTVKPPVRVSPFGDAEPKAPGIPEVELPPADTPPAELPTPKPPALNRGARRAAPGSAPRQVRRARPQADSSQAVDRNRRVAVPKDLAENMTGAVAPAVALASATEASESGNIRLSSYEEAKPKDTNLAGITLNGTLTAPLNRDGRPGDEGLMLVVEPRNDEGELIPAAGELSVSVLDPAATSEMEARIGRWNFSIEETTRLYRRTTLGDGIQLNLLWQDRPPTHNRLELYVRLITPDGRKLQTSRTIEVTLPSPAAPVPADEPRRLGPEAAAAKPEKGGAESPAAPRPDPFEILPVTAAPVRERYFAATRSGFTDPDVTVPAAPVKVQPASPRLSKLPVVDHARSVAPARPPVDANPPAITAAPAPIRSAASARPQSRRVLPVRPPAEEQVAIPLEPGAAADPVNVPAAPPAPPERKPQWAPYRP